MSAMNNDLDISVHSGAENTTVLLLADMNNHDFEECRCEYR